MVLSKKHDDELIEQLIKNVTIDKETGNFKSPDHYMSIAVNIGWKGGIVSVPAAHLAWLLMHGRWPEEGKVIDHINDDPMDNRPENLQEITQSENQAKRRNRKPYRSYGKGKYGHGISIYYDKKWDWYYVTHQPSRGTTGLRGNLKIAYGKFKTLQEAETRVEQIIQNMHNPVDTIDELFAGYSR